MNIIEAMLDAITQTDEWNQMQNAPAVTEAEQIMKKAIMRLPERQQDEVASAAYTYALICERAALLFGLGLIDKLRAAGNDPAANIRWKEE